MLCLLLVGGLSIWWGTRSNTVAAVPGVQVIGGTYSCRAFPKFALARGFQTTALLSTSERTIKGLLLYDPAQRNAEDRSRAFRDESWDDAGYLGPLVLDEAGNIYVAPVPRVSLVDNPPAQQNTIFRVDTTTGVMAPFIALPGAATPSSQNPFGILGLAYDCDTRTLYATSVAGSGPDAERGRIFQIDVATKTIKGQLNDVDAIGIGVFNGAKGKRLYWGTARVAEIHSVALQPDGSFTGNPRTEFTIAPQPIGQNDKARRLNFIANSVLQINGVQFDFNLRATSEQINNHYQYRYDASKDRWQVVTDATSSPVP